MISQRPGGHGLRMAFARYQSIGLDEDFIQHLAHYLCENPGLPVTTFVMRVVCDRFSQKSYQAAREYHTNYTREFMAPERLDDLGEMGREALMGEAADRTTTAATPYLTTLLREVAVHLDDQELLLMLAGQLDPQDVARLRAQDPDDLIDLIGQYRHVLPMVAEWVRQHAAR